jgi:phosphatidate cytidylyltransferase
VPRLTSTAHASVDPPSVDPPSVDPPAPPTVASASEPQRPPHAADPPDVERRRADREFATNVRSRLISAAILIAAIVTVVWFGGWVAFGAAVVVLALCFWELHGMFAHAEWNPALWLSFLLGLDFLVAAMLPAYRWPLLGLGISALIIGAFAWLMVTRKGTLERTLTDWALTMATPFYVGWPIAFFLLIRGMDPTYRLTSGQANPGFWWLLTMFFTVWAFDTAAFFAGRFFGRHRLAPLISPKKTWEGAAGGLVLALAAAVLFTLPIGIPWYHALVLGALVSVAATVGDLAESLLKRDVDVKDSGSLISGHGGIMDRIDSLLFASMVVFFYAAFLHSIPFGP